MYVLEGPTSHSTPLNPQEWHFAGRVGGLPEHQWAIDGTVVELQGSHYFVYSGWPLEGVPDESKQELFIMRMVSPIACAGEPVRISTPDYQWEYSGRSGINEGPQLLMSPDGFGEWVGIAYSCAGSWTSEYKMGVLRFVPGSDPLDPRSWVKRSRPLLCCRRDGRPPYGPGHGNFVLVDAAGGGNGTDGGRLHINNGTGAVKHNSTTKEVWAVFHATDRRTGWEGRRARVMRVGWGPDGPFMGNKEAECGAVCECGDLEGFLYGIGAAKDAAGKHDEGRAGVGHGAVKNLTGELKGLVVGVRKDPVATGKGLVKRLLK
jgi:hypothetical protein